MRHRLRALVILASATLALSGCASSSAAPIPTSTAASSARPTPTAEPTAAPHLVLTVDGLTLVGDQDTASAGFDDAAALLDLLERATGTRPAPTPVEDLPGYDMNLVNYDWDGVKVATDESGAGFARVVVTSPTVNGVPIATTTGFAVGSPREALEVAGARDVFDSDGDGIADDVSLDEREAPGTTSLSEPGQVGVEYLLFSLTDDVVISIHAPANDFSDL